MPERIRYYYELVDRAASARTVVSTRDQLSDAILVRTPRCPTLPEDSPVHSRVVLIAPSQLSQQQCHALDSPCILQHPALNCIANAAAVTVSNSASPLRVGTSGLLGARGEGISATSSTTTYAPRSRPRMQEARVAKMTGGEDEYPCIHRCSGT